MIFGKFAIVTYIFSAVLLGVAFMLITTVGINIYPDGTVTQSSIDTLAASHEINVTPNLAFVFGDFIQGLIAIGGILFSTATGGVFFDMLRNLPWYNVAMEAIFRILLTFSGACLVINFLTGRDL